MKYNFKADFQKGLLPNSITLLGLLTIPAILRFHVASLFFLTCCFFALGWFCDFLDGYIARRFNMQSKIGDFFDPLADKIVTWSMLAYFWDRIPTTASTIIITFGVLATIGRIIILSAGKKLKIPTNVMANMAGKIKTNFEKGGIAALLLLDLFMLHWPGIQISEVFQALMLIGLWGSIPLGFISLVQMARKLRVLAKSYA